jgi:tetratricopeptide (TPR) repeat protein
MGKASRKRKALRSEANRHRTEVDHASTDTTRPPGVDVAPTPGARTGTSIFTGRALWVSLSLIAATLIIYANVRLYPFVNSDDPVYLNAHVLQGLTWNNVRWAFTDATVPYWHPLTFLSHMLDVSLFGTNAGGHHVTNVILHVASTLMLFGLMLQMTGWLGRSAVIAALFGLHPLRVESVAWVAERKDVLSTFFWIATTWAYVRYVHRPRARRYAAVIVLFASGLMAKPMIVTLPFTLLLLDYWPLHRINLDGTPTRRHGPSLRGLLSEKIPLFALAALASLGTFAAQREVGAVNTLEAIPLGLRVANALHSYVAYIGDLIWPARLAALYPYPGAVSDTSLFISMLVLAAVTALVVVGRRQYPYLLVGWLWYLGTLLPVVGVIQVGPQARADRFTYVPHIGLLLMLVWGIHDLMRRWSNRRVVLVPAAAAAIAACIIVARRQAGYWRSSTTLWEHTLAVTRNNGVAHYNLGLALAGAGQDDDAISHLREATRLEPDFAFAHNRLALALDRRGDLAGSRMHLAEVVRLMPTSAEAYANLGVALAQERRYPEAIAAFSKALELNPADATSRSRLEFLRRGLVKSPPP